MSRRCLQANITKAIIKKEGYDPHYRIRKKLDRWKLDGTPRAQVDRFQRYLGLLKNKVQPRVVAAILKTAWNGWGTERRFQVSNPNRTRCLLGCTLPARDCIEHYDRCATVRTLHEELGGTKADRRLPLSLGTATAHTRRDDCNPCDAKSVYATFITTNAARRRGGITAEEAGIIFRDAFQQAGDDNDRTKQPTAKKRRRQDVPAGEGNGQGRDTRTCKKRRGPEQAPPGQR